jgi:hypothetical protein
MTSIIIDDFSGIAPKINPKQLNNNMAQTAEDAYLDHKDLRPYPGLGSTAFSAASSTWISMYLYRGTTLIGSTYQREYAEAPVKNDTFFRIIETGREVGDYPRVMVTGEVYYRLGIPAPATAMTVTPTQTPSDPNAVDAETISYVYTFVDSFGNEGPPSLPSTSVDRVRDTDVDLTSLEVAPSGNYNFGAGSVKRIYRSNAGTDSTAFQFALEIPIATTLITDSIDGANLQEVLPSATWTGPPDDDTTEWTETMRGITNMPNGILAGFTAKTLVFNEPYLLHAWPVDYALTFSDRIVAITAIAAGLLVVTEEQPFLVSGIHPASMAVQPLDIKQGCRSDRSLVDMGEYAIYASNDGLVGVFGVDAELMTENFISRDQWNDTYKPDTITAFAWEGKYIGFYEDGGTKKGFVFDPREGTRSFTPVSQWVEAGVYSPILDELLVKPYGTSTVSKWGTNYGSPWDYTWTSKQFITPKPVSFASIRVETLDFDYSDLTISVTGDGVLRDVINTVTTPFDKYTPYTRLGAEYGRAKVWEVTMVGASTVTYIGLFESISEAI